MTAWGDRGFTEMSRGAVGAPMSYVIPVFITQDHHLLVWCPLRRVGILRHVKIPRWILIPQGKLKVKITRWVGCHPDRNPDPDDYRELGSEQVSYQWVGFPRLDVWWASGVEHTLAVNCDTGEYSRLVNEAAHDDASPLLRKLFAPI